LKLIFEPLNTLSTPGSTLKIFITRNKSRLRFIENQEEIQAVAEKAGLSIIDTDQLKPVEQIRIFSQAAVIVGIHGAGLMNMVFRRSECKVLEIFAPPSDGYLPFHYIMLANMMGFQYQGLIGERGKKRYSGGFYISPAVFEQAITELLSA
jgi:capsular polysaccharide biosynthesis protein